MSQYVYSMLRVSKVVPPQKTIIKDISPFLLPRRENRPARFERRGQVHRAADYGGRG